MSQNPTNYRFKTRDGEIRRGMIVDRLTGKTSKQDVNYRAHNQDTKESCAECEHYLSPGEDNSSCRRVAGLVYGEDTCDIFVARKVEQAKSNQEISITVTTNPE